MKLIYMTTPRIYEYMFTTLLLETCTVAVTRRTAARITNLFLSCLTHEVCSAQLTMTCTRTNGHDYSLIESLLNLATVNSAPIQWL